MSIRRIVVFVGALMFVLSAVAAAATPWIALTSPNPQEIWQQSTDSMVKNDNPLGVWQSGKKYMVVWDYEGLSGNVKIEMLKAGAVVALLSPAGGTPVGEVGKGFMETAISASAGPGVYQIRVSSMEVPNIASVSEPITIIVGQ